MRFGSLLPLLAIALAACENAREAAQKGPPMVVYSKPGVPAGLDRYRKWSDRIGQGAQPEGEVAFRNLASLGYKTVLTVDGAVPDTETASKFGLAYVHVPIGYDGIPTDALLQIVKAVESSPGPVYVHCHHGKHRGPAAAMIARICVEGVSREDALQGLEESETSPNYTGLWRSVREVEVPDAEALAKVRLSSRVVPEGVRAMMVSVSHRYEFLKASKAVRWAVPPGHPDVSPPHEARMLWELYREMARLEDAKGKGEQFLAFAKQGEEAAVALERALRAGETKAAGEAYRLLKANCNACHADFRN